jgi:cobalt-precorrin 5A hydrolase
MPGSFLYFADRLPAPADFTPRRRQGFGRLQTAVATKFLDHAGHVFVMSTGIVVRTIAPLLKTKTTDPAVVVIDEAGRHAISLVSATSAVPTPWLFPWPGPWAPNL